MINLASAVPDANAGMISTTVGNAIFLGHPRGLAFLAFTEAWERFSFYGMQSLLVLYMVQALFLLGQIDNVAGMAAYRGAVEAALGPLSAQALAGQTFGFYTGLVYFTPSDRWLGGGPLAGCEKDSRYRCLADDSGSRGDDV